MTTKENEDKKEIKKEEHTEEIPKDFQEFIDAGVQFGHNKSNVHPGMFPFIFGIRNNIHIIDVAKTREKLDEALEFIGKLIEDGKVILFVATKLPVRDIVREAAEEAGMPFMVNRWYGGTLTNWSTIHERVEHLKDLKEKKKTEEWKKYPKHERMKMDKEIVKLEGVLGGLVNLEKLPDAMFLADVKENNLAAREAKKMKIISIGIVDTNVNPEDVDYPIPANDDSVMAVDLIVGKVRKVMKKSKKGKVASTVKKTTSKIKTKSKK